MIGEVSKINEVTKDRKTKKQIDVLGILLSKLLHFSFEQKVMKEK